MEDIINNFLVTLDYSQAVAELNSKNLDNICRLAQQYSLPEKEQITVSIISDNF